MRYPATSQNRESGIPILVMSGHEFTAWHGRGWAFDYAAQAQHGAPFALVPGKGFRWTCPDCGRPYLARTGDEPISGWDNPQWVLSGTADAPTATPSLGCGAMKDGPGHHWWLRDGRLVAA